MTLSAVGRAHAEHESAAHELSEGPAVQPARCAQRGSASSPGRTGARGRRSGGSTGVASVVGGVTGSFQGLATHYDGSPLVALTALLAALALGAGHAVAPGHGKTIMAFYLSGRRQGALRAATTVGATVTATHTAGVLALGVLVSAGTAFVPARVYPWLDRAFRRSGRHGRPDPAAQRAARPRGTPRARAATPTTPAGLTTSKSIMQAGGAAHMHQSP